MPTHELTDNYVAAMLALGENRLADAARLFLAEPESSPCYGLATANAALTLLRLERGDEADLLSKRALKEFRERFNPHPPTAVQTARNLAEAVAIQGRRVESLQLFDGACHLADELIAKHPEHAQDIELEKGHVFNSWGASLLQLGSPKDAIDAFSGGRDIYRKYPHNGVGLAETLTNLALAYAQGGNVTAAGLALDEARTLAKGDENQLIRVEIAAIQMGVLSDEEAERFLNVAAKSAQTQGFLDTAYTRHCIAAVEAEKRNNFGWGQRAISRAELLESALPAASLDPARLRFYKATFAERAGGAADNVIAILREGARMWCERIPGKLRAGDFHAATEQMHDHFRLLSRRLLDQRRYDEAYVSFETGRARAFAADITGDFSHPLTTRNPFASGNSVDLTFLREIQSRLAAVEVSISIVMLPPKLVAFVVGHEALDVIEVDLVNDLTAASDFRESLDTLASRLRGGKGLPSLPTNVFELAQAICRAVAERHIRDVSPHSLLHLVPWHALLRECGLTWNQLRFAMCFSPALLPVSMDAADLQRCVALGHGTTGSAKAPVSLEDEAREFAEAYTPTGVFVANARSEQVRWALGSGDVVLVSCHGSVSNTQLGRRFVFELADGASFPEDLLPDGICSQLVILSACDSGVYEVGIGDYPSGVAPLLLMHGVRYCICSRFPLNAHFSRAFFVSFAECLRFCGSVEAAYAAAMDIAETRGFDRWIHLACVELLATDA